MPTYDYKCRRCGYNFEEFQSILAEPLKICPRCKGPVERLISPGAGLIFKGSGFYETDYKNKSDGNGSKHIHKPVNSHATSAPDSVSSKDKD
jgi:putative FmdB family regulatory protein